MSRWSPVYQAQVLAPDYEYAANNLKNHFLDALVAHVRTVARLEEPRLPDKPERIQSLVELLQELRDTPLPEYDGTYEDFYFTIQAHLEERLPRETVSLLRIGLSRNDLDMTVYRLAARERLLAAMEKVNALRSELLRLAREHAETVIIAHTHHQPAQPTSLAHYLTGAESTISRDYARMQGAFERLNQSPMRAAALTGSSHRLARPYTARLLGFEAPVENTYDAVGGSDWQLELAGVIQTAAVGLSRVLYDLLYWASQGLLSLPDGLVQGSSIMPQKRNPVALEHARARFSKAVGHAQAIVYSNHNIPYGDLNDPGPDIQNALTLVSFEFSSGLELLTACLAGLRVNLDGWSAIVTASDTTATELADVLAQRHGVSFQDAHRIAATLVRTLAQEGRTLSQATPEDLQAAGGPQGSAESLREAISAFSFIERRAGYGGPKPATVRDHLLLATRRLEADCQHTNALAQGCREATQALSTPRKEKA